MNDDLNSFFLKTFETKRVICIWCKIDVFDVSKSWFQNILFESKVHYQKGPFHDSCSKAHIMFVDYTHISSRFLYIICKYLSQ
jgi:hypothetical protein